MKNSARSMKPDEVNVVLDSLQCGKSVSSAVCEILPDLRKEPGKREIIKAPFTPIFNKILRDESTEELTRKLSLVVISLSLVVLVLFSVAPVA